MKGDTFGGDKGSVRARVCVSVRAWACVRDEGISITRRAPSLYLRNNEAGETEKELNPSGGKIFDQIDVTELYYISK